MFIRTKYHDKWKLDIFSFLFSPVMYIPQFSCLHLKVGSWKRENHGLKSHMKIFNHHSIRRQAVRVLFYLFLDFSL